MDCKNCLNYGFREMISKPYGYSGKIPCLNCKHFSFQEDNFVPAPISNAPLEKSATSINSDVIAAPKQCAHEWVDGINPKVQGLEVCLLCHEIRWKCTAL